MKQTVYKEIPVTHLWQGDSRGDVNGCGTACLAMALNYLSQATSQGKKTASLQSFSRQMLDFKRPFDMYSSPGMLIRAASEYGFFARGMQYCSFEEIKADLDQGRLIIALINVRPHRWDSLFHYVVIHGYELDPENSLQQKLIVTDPGDHQPEKAKRSISYPDFYAQWRHLKFAQIPTGIDCFGVVLDQKSQTIVGPSFPWLLQVADIINRLASVIQLFKKRLSSG